MLTTHLNTLPFTKFVLIEDSVAAKGDKVLNYLLKNHERRQDYRTHFLIFEGYFNKVGQRPSSVHDFTTNSQNFKQVVTSLKENCVVVVDSLVQVLYRYGLLETYRIFAELKSAKNVQQIVALLHADLLEERDKTVQYFRHLATLHMQLEPKRVLYTFKKSQRKIIKQVEEYRFDNDTFLTQTIKKPDPEAMKEAVKQVNPEDLSTFKISLSEKDKESRESLVLPYLPKDDAEAKIHYQFDDIDDWDEEDPDDDLDI